MKGSKPFTMLGCLLLGAGLALAAGCGFVASESDSESHFLVLCDGACPDGLSCVCGKCSKPCTTDDSCRSLASEARCYAPGSRCGSDAVTSSCDVECVGNPDCAALGAGYRCEAGFCAAAHGEVNAGMNSDEPPSNGGSAGAAGSGSGMDAGAPSLVDSRPPFVRNPDVVRRECAGVRRDPTLDLLPQVHISTQAELNALEGCEVIEGDLGVEVYEPFGADLRPLYALREVTGALRIKSPLQQNLVSSLEGLESLERIGWGLSLENVQAPSLAPLARLRSIGADIVGPVGQTPTALVIKYCNAFEDLLALSNVETPITSLVFWENARLRSLAGPPLAQRMGDVQLRANPALVDLDALAATQYALYLEIGNEPVTDLAFLASLRSALVLQIHSNVGLQDVSTLASGLATVGLLDISNNATLEALPAFTQLTAAAALMIVSNPALESVAGFPLLERIEGELGGSLQVEDNPKLQRLLGVGALQAAQRVSIQRNASLQQLELDVLRAVAGQLAIASNPQLSVSSLPFLLEVEAEAFKVGGNAGDPTLLEPCPWVDDRFCDEPPTDTLCAAGTDTGDCSIRRL